MLLSVSVLYPYLFTPQLFLFALQSLSETRFHIAWNLLFLICLHSQCWADRCWPLCLAPLVLYFLSCLLLRPPRHTLRSVVLHPTAGLLINKLVPCFLKMRSLSTRLSAAVTGSLLPSTAAVTVRDMCRPYYSLVRRCTLSVHSVEGLVGWQLWQSRWWKPGLPYFFVFLWYRISESSANWTFSQYWLFPREMCPAETKETEFSFTKIVVSPTLQS